MKLWEKIFISTLIVFQVFFISSSIYLINKSLRLNLDSEINSGISEQNRLCNLLEANIYLVKIHENPNSTQNEFTKKETDSIISTCMSYFKGEKIYINVMDEAGEKITDGFKPNINITKQELNTPLNKITYVIRDVNGQSYVFINKRINLNNNNYRISYIKDISSVYENEKSMFSLLIKLNIFVSIVLAVVMIILSKIIVKPINKLIKSTQEISEGNFSERVKVETHDEIGLLAKNFNNMADVIEDKINVLKNVSKDKQRFIDNLTHEIRTPLTSIIGYADFLRTNKCDEKTTIESLTYIYTQGKRLEKLSSKLMDLIILNKENIDKKNINVKKLLEEINSSVAAKLKTKAITLNISSEDFNLMMDKELIIILLSNLIDNAVKASESGAEISLKAYKDTSAIEVSDNGVGISEEDVEKIFEPFYMVDKSRNRSSKGVGLGLSICAQIAEIHNAKISVISELGKGTRIRVMFNKS